MMYLVENLWVDGWLRNQLGGLPTLVPEPVTPSWLVMFALGGMVCVVLVVCQVLVSRHRRISLRGKLCTGMAVVVACGLWGVWFITTSRASPAAATRAGQPKHSVTLTWNASASAVAGYNVYRSTLRGRGYLKINAALVRDGLTYKDETVESGKTYYYVTRAVDMKGKESGNSAEVVATVP
jgi:hypothetical protein